MLKVKKLFFTCSSWIITLWRGDVDKNAVKWLRKGCSGWGKNSIGAKNGGVAKM